MILDSPILGDTDDISRDNELLICRSVRIMACFHIVMAERKQDRVTLVTR
jgi:hypothetical protein